jgi:tRNA nucleotidyltransferase (CCA-adding enzyme)
VRLEAILAQLAPAYRQPVAQNLQLPVDSISRLENLAAAEAAVTNVLPTCDRPSQVVGLLKQYDRAILILIVVRCDRSTIRRQMWRYLTIWANLQPLLTGDDLRQLGYQPGPQFRQILDELTIATLDGKIADRAAAEVFVSQY